MSKAYIFSGIGLLIVLSGAWYAFSRSSPQVQTPTVTLDTIATSTDMELQSSAFLEGEEIPTKYTCEGENISPPLSIVGVPEGAQSLALIMHDPDVPKNLKKDGIFDHWVMFNLIPTTTEIGENEAPGIEGVNGAGRLGYMGSCPPKEYEPTRHRYIFTLYALKQELALPQGAKRGDVLEAIEGLVLASTTLTATYEKKN